MAHSISGWIPVRTAARRLGVSRQAVYRRVWRGTLRARELGDRFLLVDEHEVAQLVARKSRKEVVGDAEG